MPGLRVTAGDGSQMQPVRVNRDSHPITISNDEFEGQLTVRIKGFKPPTGSTAPTQPESGYFDEHSSLTWSIAVAGRVKKPWGGDELVFGNTFDKPIRQSLPYGTAIALKAIAYIDPALEQDIYADKPWAFSPLLATMPVLNISKLSSAPDWSASQPAEDVDALFAADDPHRGQLVGNAAARRKVFAAKAARQAVTISPDHFLAMDFAQGMINFSDLSVTIPVANISFDLAKYWDGQPVRFVARNREGTRELFRIEFIIADDAIVQEKLAAGHDVAGAQAAVEEALNDEID